MVNFLFALIELFSLFIIRFRGYEAKCVRRVFSHQPLWYQKTRDTGLPDGEDLISTRFGHNTGI